MTDRGWMSGAREGAAEPEEQDEVSGPGKAAAHSPPRRRQGRRRPWRARSGVAAVCRDEAWRNRPDLRNLDVVGHSYGGGVAQWPLVKCRPRIRRLALLPSCGLGREVYPLLRIASVPLLLELFGQRWIAHRARRDGARDHQRCERRLPSSLLSAETR